MITSRSAIALRTVALFALLGVGWLWLAPSALAFEQALTVRCDAQDGTVSGWDVYDNDPVGAITNVVDPAAPASSNRVIRLQGGATATGYRLTFSPTDTTEFKLQWRMWYGESYTLYISCNTSAGHRYVYYTPDATSSLGTGEYVHHGLGAATYSSSDPHWVVLRRDIQHDLNDAQPGVMITGITGILVRGSGYLDDIRTYDYVDSDRDLVPDVVETANNLNPNDPSDGAGDLDSDGLSNAREIVFGTDIAVADTDGDALADGQEIDTYRTEPLSVDTDLDTVDDGEEVACGMDPLVPALDGPGYLFDQRILEDAEDQDTVGWDLFDADPPGTLSNAADPVAPQNRVIAFDGPFDTGYRLTFSPYETRKHILEWRMRASSNFLIYANCYTTAGWLSVRYVPSTVSPNLGLDPIVALGSGIANGQWVTVRRNLLGDVRRLHPNAEIIYVYGFMARGLTCLDDVSLLAYPDQDLDVIPDSVELAAGLDPQDPDDAALDGDADGLSNLDEFMHGTDMADADSDDDGLDDGSEIAHGADPLDEDTDDDSLLDGWEVAHGMDPTTAALQGNGFLFECTVLDDAEDGLVSSWDVYDVRPGPGYITNAVDPDDAANRAIQLSGFATASGFRYTFSTVETNRFKIQWRMRYSERYVVYIDCESSAGHRYLEYTPDATSPLGTGEYVVHGLGAGTVNGRWQTFRRDLQHDLAQPGVQLLSVRAFLIRGSGMVDDLRIYGFADGDGDNVPDDVETANGLNPADASDGAGDLDADTLDNAGEVIWGTDLQDADTDGDTAPDGVEVRLGLDPLDPADATALMHDATTVPDAAAGLAAAYYKGNWRYMPSFEFHPHYGTGVVTQLNLLESTGQVFTSGRGDQVGAVFAGWIDAPADGWYTLHLTNNDGAFLYIDDTQVAGIDGYVWHLGEPWQSQGDIGLRAGKHALRLEYYETYVNASLVLEWEALGLTRAVVPAANLFHSPAYLQQMDLADDADGDGLSDLDETAAGTNSSKTDTDADGLLDGEEVHTFGANPLVADSDADGIADGIEAKFAFSNPAAADFSGTVTDAVVMGGDEALVETGTWQVSGTEIAGRAKRGKLAFAFTLEAASCYRIQVTGYASTGYEQNNAFPFIGFLDGECLGANAFTVAFGTDGSVCFFTPWLTAGQHTFHLLWDNVYNVPSLTVKTVCVQALGGPDADANGRADWIDHRLAATNSLDAVPATSHVSPLCIEGTGHFLSGLSISGAVPVQRGAWRRWYADLPLAEAGATTATVAFDHGAKSANLSTTWVATNVLSDADVTLRQGDALRLIALPEGATGGTVQIAIGGTQYNTTPDAPVAHTFANAGTYTVSGTYTPAQGDPVTGSLDVTVVECAQPEPPAVWRDRERAWTWTGVPEVAVLEATNIDLRETAQSATSRTMQLLRSEVLEDVRIVARLGTAGPVLASVTTAGFWLREAVEGYTPIIETFPDGSTMLENQIFTYGLPDTVRIHLTVAPAGVSFDDGTIVRDITAADFDELGVYVYHMLRTDPQLSICRNTTVYQGAAVVGERH